MFYILYNLDFKKTTQLIMPLWVWQKLWEIHLIIKDLVVVFSLIYKKLLILLIIEFCFQNWNIMVFVDVPLSGLDHICLIDNNMFLLMEVILTCFQSLVVYLKALYWVLYSSFSISMICQMLLRNLLFISLLMIQTSTMNSKIYLPWVKLSTKNWD